VSPAPLVKAARKALDWAVSVAIFCLGLLWLFGYMLLALAIGTYISGGSL